MSATGTNSKYTFLTTSHKITVNLHGGSRQILAGARLYVCREGFHEAQQEWLLRGGRWGPVRVQCRLALQFPPSSSGEASVGTLGDQAKPQKAHGLAIQTTLRNKGQNLGLRTDPAFQSIQPNQTLPHNLLGF